MQDNIIDWNTKYPVLSWKGHEWQLDAEAHRKIHPDYPYEYYWGGSVTENWQGVILTIKDLPQKVSHWNGEIYNSKYARGMIRSVDAMTYGTYTLKCILPNGRGLHSSFWLSARDSWPPEIDIFEAYSNRCGGYFTWPAKVWPNIARPGYRVRSNIHYGSRDNHFEIDPEDCFLEDLRKPILHSNEYKLVWKPDEIAIYYNQHLVRLICDTVNPELFNQLNKSPWMNVMIDIGVWEDDLDKNLEMREFQKHPDWRPEFILENFEYKPLDLEK